MTERKWSFKHKSGPMPSGSWAQRDYDAYERGRLDGFYGEYRPPTSATARKSYDRGWPLGKLTKIGAPASLDTIEAGRRHSQNETEEMEQSNA